MSENKQSKTKLERNRVFFVIKPYAIDLVIANEDYTKFRSLDQLINKSGYTDVVFTINEVDRITNRKNLINCLKLSTGEKLVSATNRNFDKYFEKKDKCSITELLDFKKHLSISFGKYNFERSAKDAEDIKENSEEYLKF